jgi:hypothetical protein
MNRLEEQSEEGDAQIRAGDYFVVCGELNTWVVSTEMARHIEACLDRVPPPKWVTFVELSGARIRVRTREIECIAQSTAEQRAAERAFNRKLRQEHKADRSWDEDE